MEERNVTPLSPAERNEIWKNTFDQIRQLEKKKRRRKRSIFTMAVVILLLSSLWTYHSFFEPDVYIAGSKGFKITLGDGTKVTLLHKAKLTVAKSFPANTREVRLEGNAIFHVAKSKEHPFIVHGNGYDTKVLGTIFKIIQDGKSFYIDLYEGKVNVYKVGQASEAVTIQPEHTFSNYGSSNVASVTKTNEIRNLFTKDKSATLIFNECPVSDAVKVIEKTYSINIYYPKELTNVKITVSAPNATAETFLQSLAIQLNLNINQNNDSIFKLEK